jgi:hypothetical protein
MYAGAAVTALAALVIILVAPRVGVLHIGTLRPIVESHTRQVARAAFTGALQCVAWLWMAWKNKRGRAWARVLSTIFFGLSCIATPLDLGTGAIESRVLSVVIWLVALAATVQLWRRESGPFYRRQAHRPSNEVSKQRLALPTDSSTLMNECPQVRQAAVLTIEMATWLRDEEAACAHADHQG